VIKHIFSISFVNDTQTEQQQSRTHTHSISIAKHNTSKRMLFGEKDQEEASKQARIKSFYGKVFECFI